MDRNNEKPKLKACAEAWKKLCARKMRYHFDIDFFAETVVATYKLLKKYQNDERPPVGTKRIFRLMKRFIGPVYGSGCNAFYAARTVAEDLYLSFGESDMIGDYEGGVTVESIEFAIDELIESFQYAEE